MKLRVGYSGQARSIAGRSFDDLDLPPFTTLHDLLAEVARLHGPRMATLLQRPQGAAPTLLIFLGQQQVNWNAPPALKAGDEIMLVSPISGG